MRLVLVLHYLPKYPQLGIVGLVHFQRRHRIVVYLVLQRLQLVVFLVLGMPLESLSGNVSHAGQ